MLGQVAPSGEPPPTLKLSQNPNIHFKNRLRRVAYEHARKDGLPTVQRIWKSEEEFSAKSGGLFPFGQVAPSDETPDG